MKTDKRVDAYIAKAPPFARPILAETRKRIRGACPDAEETIKWKVPFFLLDGKLLASMAAFKKHAKIGVWEDGKGTFVDVTSLTGLPSAKAFAAQVTAAVKRSGGGAALTKKTYRLRRSPVHGSGLFATRAIKKGERIIEYTGERISHAEADRRHAHKADDDNHTFLFTIDAKTVIDADVGGNDSRFINHSCDPSCEVLIADGRPLVEAIRDIAAGEELAYDYYLTRDPDDPPETEAIFACHCGTAKCRGTMLAPRKLPKAKEKPKAKPRVKASAKGKGKGSPKKKAAPAKKKKAR